VRLVRVFAIVAALGVTASTASVRAQSTASAEPRPATRVRSGLLIAGIVTFGVLYGLSLAVGSAAPKDDGVGALVIPVVGPFVASSNAKTGGSGALVLDGAGQVAGVLMIVSAYAFPETVASTNAGVRVLPMIAGNGGGLVALGAF